MEAVVCNILFETYDERIATARNRLSPLLKVFRMDVSFWDEAILKMGYLEGDMIVSGLFYSSDYLEAIIQALIDGLKSDRRLPVKIQGISATTLYSVRTLIGNRLETEELIRIGVAGAKNNGVTLNTYLCNSGAFLDSYMKVACKLDFSEFRKLWGDPDELPTATVIDIIDKCVLKHVSSSRVHQEAEG